MRNSVKFSLAILIAAITAVGGGCTRIAIESHAYDKGMVYHLPRTILTVSVVQYTDKDKGRTWYQIGTPVPKGDGVPGTAPQLAPIESASIPDPGHRYVAKYQPSPFSDDRLCMSRTPTGLLHDVHFASDDRTSEVVFNISRFIAGSLGGARKTGITIPGTANALDVRTYTGRLDPLNKIDVSAFNRAMREVFGENVNLDFSRMLKTFKKHTAQLPEGCEFGEYCEPQVWTDRCSRDNICYRTQLEVPLDLRRNGQRVDVNYAKVINPWDVGAISASRSFLVHKISKFKFDNGVLVGAVIRKPSEIEEVSLLPLHIIYAALHTPSAALATAFSTNDASKDEVAKQLQALTSEINKSNSQIASLQSGLNPATDLSDKQTYQLTCAAPKSGSGDLINLVTGSKIN